MKAKKSREQIILRLLNEVNKADVAIVAVVVDQKAIVHPPKVSEDIYRIAATRAVHHVVQRWPVVEICLDRRYTNEALRDRLEQHIREGIADIPRQIVMIRQEDSIKRKELQLVDFVAWAFFQKYEKNDDRFYQVIAPKIVKEELLELKDWAAEHEKKNPPSGG
jgi:hypothetical protein